MSMQGKAALEQLAEMSKIKANIGKLVCIGDSITEGPTPPPAPNASLSVINYPQWLSWLTGRTVINSGISGNQLPNIEARLETDVFAHNPFACVFLVGSNDIHTAQLTVSQCIPYIERITEKTIAKGIVPIWVSVLPRPADATKVQTVIQYNRFLERYCYENGFTFVDAYGVFVDTNGAVLAGLQYDQIHNYSLGNKTLATAVYNKVKEMFITDIPGFWYGETQGVPNPLFLTDANGDGVADSWEGACSGGVTATYSLVARTSKGNWQQIAKNAGGDASSHASVSVTIPTALGVNWEVGKYIDIACDIDTDAALNGCEWNVRMNFVNAAWETIFIRQVSLTKCSVPVSNLRIFSGILVPASTAHVVLYFSIYGAGAATARIGQVVARKRTT